ncbi:hypothetical protein [Blastochloris sulfoviridis]|uniref:Uncharacterized protein n=1 Tax=Blastochloris sulfoviridis TaxID=50712 RepID=A0A5M6HMV2_9HYPH|nr:hypothetical protein [Blastochloris sulfoviridis]KAA5597186.1 hypothetical protein F1193_14925 [Blastochloris sulfoviridis]NJL08918.1 hypothetical protein [Candidatus Methylacidiphilales bacterium]
MSAKALQFSSTRRHERAHPEALPNCSVRRRPASPDRVLSKKTMCSQSVDAGTIHELPFAMGLKRLIRARDES